MRITEVSAKEILVVQQDYEFQLVFTCPFPYSLFSVLENWNSIFHFQIIEDDSSVTLKFLENVDYNLDTEKSAEFSSLNEYLNHLLTPTWLILLKENLEFECELFALLYYNLGLISHNGLSTMTLFTEINA